MRNSLILILGCHGQVGWELTRVLAPLAKVIAWGRLELDLADPVAIQTQIRQMRPTVIVNAAAYTEVDKAESEPDRARAINTIAPGILAEETRRTGSLLVHYSTDYVFDGTRIGAYQESDPAQPLNVYGRTKLQGELAVQAAGGRHLIFRLSWVYGTRRRNFLRTILHRAIHQEEVRVVNDQRGCPTWSRWVAQATAFAVTRALQNPSATGMGGVYHLAASGIATWHQFAQAIVDEIPEPRRRCHRVTPISTSEYPLPAMRPANSALDCTRMEQVFGLRLADWRAGLKALCAEDGLLTAIDH
jgi:dTDP-4-dehydrorhamnose reductase